MRTILPPQNKINPCTPHGKYRQSTTNPRKLSGFSNETRHWSATVALGDTTLKYVVHATGKVGFSRPGAGLFPPSDRKDPPGADPLSELSGWPGSLACWMLELFFLGASQRNRVYRPCNTFPNRALLVASILLLPEQCHNNNCTLVTSLLNSRATPYLEHIDLLVSLHSGSSSI